MGNSVVLRLVLAVVLTMSFVGEAFGAKPLSEKDRVKLSEIARNQYNLTQMDGASVYRFKGRDVLVVITEVKKSSNAQRVGQVKASRLAGEFLQSATNRSVTVYEVADGSSYDFSDKSSENTSTQGAATGDRISQSTNDMTTTTTQETFSDKIVQSSMTRVGQIEPLCRIGADGTNIIMAYFLVLEK